MLTFFDESGTNGTSNLIVVAGWIATANDWGRFGDEWEAELNKKPRIPWLHMTEVYSDSGPWKCMPFQQREGRLLSLAQIISRHNLRGITHTTPVDQAILWLPCNEDKAENCAFSISVRGAIEQAYDAWGEAGGSESMTVHFDAQSDKHKNQRLRAIVNGAFDYIESDRHARSGKKITVAVSNDQIHVPIQAADLLAWHMNRFNMNHRLGPPKEPWRPVYDIIRRMSVPNLIEGGSALTRNGLPPLGNPNDRR